MSQRACDAVGIDLGTTYSGLAYIDPQMTPRMVQDGSGQAVVPSAVYFDDDEIIVGNSALEEARICADRAVRFIKVHMGDEWRRTISGHVHTPESISAIILRHLVREAAPQIGPIGSAVITVPAYFTERRRRATQQAGEIAGLKVIATLNEPMAATLAYGLYRNQDEQTIAVYDLGGGTFDVTVVRMAPGEIEELATDGNRQLGGLDWDRCLLDFVADDFAKAHGSDLRSDPQAAEDALVECERAKQRLSKKPKTTIRIHAFHREHVVPITRSQFESLTADLLHQTKLTAELALEHAGLRWSDLSRVVLVGGSTHMPAVRQMLMDVSGIAPDTGVNPVLAVALGAATYAHMLDRGESIKTMSQAEREELPQSLRIGPEVVNVESEQTATDLSSSHAVEPEAPQPADVSGTGAASAETVVDAADDESVVGSHPPGADRSSDLPNVRFVTAHGVGVIVQGSHGPRNSVLIPGNTPVPASITKRFLTAQDTTGYTHIRVEITQGDTRELDAAERLGTGRIEGMAPGEPAGQPVDVTMQFDEQGRLHVTALYVKTGQVENLSLDYTGGLRSEEVREQREFLSKSGIVSQFDPETALGGLDDVDDVG